MVHSNARKLLLSGWLKNNGNAEYNSPLKLQKFLLFYEAFAKINQNTTDFSYLKGYKRGPVFSNVWGDYTYERTAFDQAAEEAYVASYGEIIEEYAKKSHFLVRILSEKELSDLTHKLHIWKSKEMRIMQGERQVELYESDFNSEDMKIIHLLDQMYPMDLIENSHIIQIDSHYFIFSKNDASRLTEQHFDVLSELSDSQELNNPVYVALDQEGRLIVD